MCHQIGRNPTILETPLCDKLILINQMSAYIHTYTRPCTQTHALAHTYTNTEPTVFGENKMRGR